MPRSGEFARRKAQSEHDKIRTKLLPAVQLLNMHQKCLGLRTVLPKTVLPVGIIPCVVEENEAKSPLFSTDY